MGEVTEQIILSILNHSRDTNEVNELISAYFETFGVTKQQYKKYDYTKLNSVLLSKGFTSMEQVVAALSAKMAALDSDTSVTPAPSGGESFLEKMEIEKIRGIITKNDIVSLMNDDRANDGMVYIGTRPVRCRNGEYDDYIGCSVEAYIRQNDAEGDELIWCREYNNDILRVESTDIYGDSGNFSLTNFVYNKNGSVRKAKISENADILYNGLITAQRTREILAARMGWVELIDNDGCGEYDVVKVVETKDYLINFVDKENKIVYDKFGAEVNLDNEKGNVKITIRTESGKTAGIDNLYEWNVITVADSANRPVKGSFRNVVVIISEHEPVQGILNKVRTNDDEKRVWTISDTEYTVSFEYDNAKGNFPAEKIGSELLFYITVNNEIIGMSLPSAIAAKQLYGICISMKEDEDNENTIIKIYNQYGKAEKYTCAERVKTDGISLKKGVFYDVVTGVPVLVDGANTGAWSDYINGKLIKYELDDNNICQIETSIPADAVVRDSEVQSPMHRVYDRSKNSLVCKNNSSFEGVLYMDDSTVVFRVPKNLENINQYRINNRKVFDSTQNILYPVEGYYMKKGNMIADVVVTENASQMYSYSNMVMVISGVSIALNDDDETVENYRCRARRRKSMRQHM